MGLANIFQEQADKKHADDNNGGKDHEPPNTGGAFQDPSKTIHMIFGGLATSENKHDKKLTSRRVLSVRGINIHCRP